MRISTRVKATGGEHGFTLLEMVVSVTLVVMMAVSLWAVFRISVSSWKRGTEFIDANQRQRSILDLVRKQMASLYGLVAPVTIESGGIIYPLFAGAGDSLQFISLSSLRFLENPGLTAVSYDVVRDPQGNFMLVEREEQYLGLDPARESFMDRRAGGAITIFDGLEAFMFEYFDPGAADRPAQWIGAWNAKEMRGLPAAISMTMVSRDSRGAGFERHLVIPIMAKPYDPRLNFVNPFQAAPQVLHATTSPAAR